MIATVTAPVATFAPGGCLPPWITPTLPTEPKPWERGCWTPVQLPVPDADVQAVEGATLLG